MTTKTVKRRGIAFICVGAALGLFGCSSHDQDQPAPEQVEATAPRQPATPPPVTVVENKAEPAPPTDDQAARDAQVLDDADATGMTARLPAGESGQANQLDVQK